MALERILNNLQIRIGLRLSSKQETVINQAHQKEIERIKTRRQLAELADALAHSDACPSEAEYVLGRSEYDPHPDHAIRFDPNHPLPDSISEYYPLVLKNQEPEPKS